MRTGVVAVAVAAAVFGCNAPATAPRGVSSSCTVTVSGTVTGTYDCRPAVTTWGSLDNTSVFTFVANPSGTIATISVGVAWDSEPTLRTYTNTDSLAQSQMTVTASGNRVWRVLAGSGSASTGDYELILTQVTYNLQEQNGKGYSVEGTLSAILTPDTTTGATGNLTLTATF